MPRPLDDQGMDPLFPTAQAKARLLQALSPGNVEKTRAGPVTA